MKVFNFRNVKIMLGLVLVFVMLNSSYAIGWHTASEILDGDFGGDYSFEGDVDFTSATVVGLDEGVWDETGSDIYYNIGDVGVGTTSPTNKLDVRGKLRIDQGASYDVWLQGGSATSGSSRNLAMLGIKASDELRLNYGGEYTGGVRIQGTKTIIDGNIGSGIPNPTHDIDIRRSTTTPSLNLQSTGSSNPAIELRSNGGGTPYIDFSDDGSSDYDARILYNSDGLQISSSNFDLSSFMASTYLDIGDSVSLASDWGTGDIRLDGSSGNFVRFEGGNYDGEQFNTITGGITIGGVYNPMYWSGNTAHPEANLARVHIKGLTEHHGVFQQYVKPGWVQIAEYNNGATRRFRQIAGLIVEDGNVGFGTKFPTARLHVSGSIKYTGTITDVSDRRLKENIEPLSSSLEKIQNIDGYTFNMINETSRQIGVMAQDVQKQFPEAVSYIDSDYKYLGVDYTQLVPVLIEAVKEQQIQIDNLNTELNELKQSSYSNN